MGKKWIFKSWLFTPAVKLTSVPWRLWTSDSSLLHQSRSKTKGHRYLSSGLLINIVETRSALGSTRLEKIKILTFWGKQPVAGQWVEINQKWVCPSSLKLTDDILCSDKRRHHLGVWLVAEQRSSTWGLIVFLQLQGIFIGTADKFEQPVC